MRSERTRNVAQRHERADHLRNYDLCAAPITSTYSYVYVIMMVGNNNIRVLAWVLRQPPLTP